MKDEMSDAERGVLIGWLFPSPWQLACEIVAGVVRLVGLYGMVWLVVAMLSNI